ncbi:hypothetical protein ACFX13_033288 [Malus domestica]
MIGRNGGGVRATQLLSPFLPETTAARGNFVKLKVRWWWFNGVFVRIFCFRELEVEEGREKRKPGFDRDQFALRAMDTVSDITRRLILGGLELGSWQTDRVYRVLVFV